MLGLGKAAGAEDIIRTPNKFPDSSGAGKKKKGLVVIKSNCVVKINGHKNEWSQNQIV